MCDDKLPYRCAGVVVCFLAGMVSMLPTVNPDLFKIDEGNVQVAQKLLEYAHPELVTANVTHISKLPNGSYTIESSQGSTVQVRRTCSDQHTFSHAMICCSMLRQLL